MPYKLSLKWTPRESFFVSETANDTGKRWRYTTDPSQAIVVDEATSARFVRDMHSDGRTPTLTPTDGGPSVEVTPGLLRFLDSVVSFANEGGVSPSEGGVLPAEYRGADYGDDEAETVGQRMCEPTSLLDIIDTDVINCEVESVVGARSLGLIATANALLQMMDEQSDRDAVREAVEHQCAVWMHG